MVQFYSIISGSSGNCTFVSDGKTKILIDCGMSGKRLESSLSRIGVQTKDIDAILITHEHIDHTKGVGVVSRRYQIPIYATKGTHSSMDIGKISDENRVIINPFKDFEIGTIGIKAFDIPHDAKEPVGYSIFSKNEKYTLATDIGAMNDILLEEIRGSKGVILESNHDIDMLQMGSYPFPLKQRILSNVGHLSNKAAAQTAVELVKSGTEHIMLGHLSEQNNLPEVAMLETYNALTQSGVNVGSDMRLYVADRFDITGFEVN